MASPNSTFVSGAILTAAQMNNLPMGIIGTANPTPAQTVTTIADMTGMSITWTPTSTSRYYMTTIVIEAYNSQASTLMSVQITDGSNNVKQSLELFIVNANTQTTATLSWVETGLSGSTTRKVRFGRGAGNTGNCITFGDQQITVMDIGSA